MAQDTVVKLIQFLKQNLEKGGLRVAKIILFGSQATGEATAESDIDLAIISEDFAGKSIFERTPLIREARWQTTLAFLLPLDIILLSPDELSSDEGLLIRGIKKGKVFV